MKTREKKINLSKQNHSRNKNDNYEQRKKNTMKANKYKNQRAESE